MPPEDPASALNGAVDVSIVVPCYNESATLGQLYSALVQELAQQQGSWELVLVDDGSLDRTRVVASELSAADSRVRVLGLSRNFGKEAAMFAGLGAAKGDSVIIMDADLQHPPELIPAMLRYGAEGWDQVVAQRNRTHEKLVRKTLSRIYYRTVNRLMDVRLTDGAGDFRLLSRRCVDALLGLGETHRFSKGMFAWVGFSQMELSYENVHSSRDASTWTLGSLLNYGIDGLLSFNTKPLRLAIWIGLGVVLFTVSYSIWLLVSTVLNGVTTPGYVTTITIGSLLGGVQLVTLGVIGEYVGRIYNETKRRPVYLLSYDSSGESASARLMPVASNGGLHSEPTVLELRSKAN